MQETGCVRSVNEEENLKRKSESSRRSRRKVSQEAQITADRLRRKRD